MPELPTGTVTFLFTDIEGSTRLLEEHGDGYSGLLEEHRRVLRSAFGRHGGVEVDTQGDAFFVAFQSAVHALAAAAEAQGALALPVRMGIHTGEPQLTGEGYVGMDVHRAARICAAAHGRQIVVSETTAQLLSDALQDLGEHRLKDLGHPIRLYQHGEAEFPPLRTLNQTNLPAQPSPLVGRERELKELLALVEESRIVTLTGPGGSGKTRLALQAAAELVERFEGGVFWVPLAALSDPELVLPTLSQAVGARNGVADYLGDRHVLLLLDNFEQVVEAAPGCSDLVGRCSNLRLLITSRELLRIAGERDYPVDPLPEADAVRLFRERAAVAEPEDAVHEICLRLDGLPLAVELAAARTRLLPPDMLLERLDKALPVLTGGRRDAPERQRTLRSTIAWSYELLEDPERVLFRRLSVFAGSFTVEAAEQVSDADLETLDSLLEKSLIRRWGSGRLGMLETIREFAAEELTNSGEAEAIRARHAGFIRELLALAEHELRGPAQLEWLRRLRPEHDNIRAALDFLSVRPDAEAEAVMATLCAYFWYLGGHFREGCRYLEHALARSATLPMEVRASLHDGMSSLAGQAGSPELARSHARESLELRKLTGNRKGMLRSLLNLAAAEEISGNAREANRLYEELDALARAEEDPWFLALSLCNRGSTAIVEGDSRHGRALLLDGLALIEEVGDPLMASAAKANLASAELELEQLQSARARFGEALLQVRDLESPEIVLWCLDGLAAVEARAGGARRGARLLGASEALAESIGYQFLPLERERHGLTERLLKESLSIEEFAELRMAGRLVSPLEAVAYALGEQGD